MSFRSSENLGDRGYAKFKEYLREYLESKTAYLWMRLKREMAEFMVSFILGEIGEENVIAVHYTDLVGGAIDREGIGRDIDLIVWVKEHVEVNSRKLNEKAEKMLRSLLRDRYGLEHEDLAGPNIIEIHVVKDLEHDLYGRLLKKPTLTIKLWPKSEREGN